MTTIRPEDPQHLAQIRELNREAFGQSLEAEIVDRIRENCPVAVSLVATIESEVVGHILFSPAVIEGASGTVQGMALGPMAVRPGHQRRGIGSALVRAGLSRMKDQHCQFVAVLGHPGFYPRFGFGPASHRGLTSQWDVPDEAFMILVFDERELAGIEGQVKFRPEFATAAT